MTAEYGKSKYACINFGEAAAPKEIADRSILINMDIAAAVNLLLEFD